MISSSAAAGLHANPTERTVSKAHWDLRISGCRISPPKFADLAINANVTSVSTNVAIMPHCGTGFPFLALNKAMAAAIPAKKDPGRRLIRRLLMGFNSSLFDAFDLLCPIDRQVSGELDRNSDQHEADHPPQTQAPQFLALLEYGRRQQESDEQGADHGHVIQSQMQMHPIHAAFVS